MKDLSKIAGVNIKMEETGLTYDQNVYPTEPKARIFDEAKEVYLAEEDLAKELYYMYRYFEGAEIAEIFTSNDIEYDLTVISPGKVGNEFIKTIGHYHGYVPNTEITYPEVYEVIDGKIEYLLQTRPDAEGNVDVVIVQAETQDKIIVPPSYGHISVNIGDIPAVSSNLQKRDLPATADYEGYAAYHGGALYRTENGWENNPQYKVRSIRKVKPKEKPEWGLTRDKPLYIAVTESPEKFNWINNPQSYDFSDVWTESETF